MNRCRLTFIPQKSTGPGPPILPIGDSHCQYLSRPTFTQPSVWQSLCSSHALRPFPQNLGQNRQTECVLFQTPRQGAFASRVSFDPNLVEIPGHIQEFVPSPYGSQACQYSVQWPISQASSYNPQYSLTMPQSAQESLQTHSQFQQFTSNSFQPSNCDQSFQPSIGNPGDTAESDTLLEYLCRHLRS